ncbi:hypothetical protein NQ317_017149 [Molorchus minor]|uniref:Uncharacterized protein n=1 Tax=Molorchus minor TaxID=1323400 RepID=A0ABQ9ITE8_9CUCU|nr:hypothetical protein NQ317_017149 [Molorchus minor]
MDPKTRGALVQECKDALEHLVEEKEGDIGNEVADELAGRESEEPYQGTEPHLGVKGGYINRAVNKRVHEKLSEVWRRSGECRDKLMISLLKQARERVDAC